jgi:hypothetical protein
MTRWTFCVPIFPARDVPAAQAWYRDVLGLGVNWIWNDDFGSVDGNVLRIGTSVPAASPPVEFTFPEEVRA